MCTVWCTHMYLMYLILLLQPYATLQVTVNYLNNRLYGKYNEYVSLNRQCKVATDLYFG